MQYYISITDGGTIGIHPSQEIYLWDPVTNAFQDQGKAATKNLDRVGTGLISSDLVMNNCLNYL